uniref:Uncharacterized protein n=1 Tax=Balaenoptera musculus TaxID=9771 RepID=A0A8C0CS44_BALMU
MSTAVQCVPASAATVDVAAAAGLEESRCQATPPGPRILSHGTFIRDSSGMTCTIMMWLLIIYLDFMVMLVLLLPSRDFWYSVVNRVVFICLVMLALSSYLRTMLTTHPQLQCLQKMYLENGSPCHG